MAIAAWHALSLRRTCARGASPRPSKTKGVPPRPVLWLGCAESMQRPNSGVLALEVFDFDPERGFPLVGPLDELPAIEDLTDEPGRRPERALHFGVRHADLDPLERRRLGVLRGVRSL